jgi:hypothetical protein
VGRLAGSGDGRGLPLGGGLRILVQQPHVVLYGDQALIELGARRESHLDHLVGPYSRDGFHHPRPAVFYNRRPPYWQ